ncbi:hypothetical protein SAMN04487895_101662 [Paenibacillus sophorae]|uniref:Uncharacterized protein n=1 Tax=Paenibacillus sophorae TaxID=1333845 RepID=A0A1H8GXW1_9BACL|nr:hypothetical protein [Paenibacillus sophorae]QWU14359.1 hypothetical protein KP014_20855 [Paenibacillus sophorae]SEN48088.1 hypothetical protein SAMN04487895_101662 [Paenibacillus sophorae]
MLIFKEVAWLNGEVAFHEAETNKGIQVQIHLPSESEDSYWFEVTDKNGIIYDSRSDKKIFSSFVDVEVAANEWFDNY